MVVGLLVACSDDGETTDDAVDAETTTTTTITSTTTPTFTGDPESPFCRLLRGVDLAGVLGGAEDDPEALGAAFQQIVDLLVDAAELAPDEIAPDVALVAEGMTSLDAALAEVGYDFDALAASGHGDEVLTAVNDPAFADAGIRLAAYRTQVCGL